MPRTFRSLIIALGYFVGCTTLTACASTRLEPMGSVSSREHVAATARDREVELSTVRAEMAATRIAAAKKEAELLELRALVAQLRQENTDTHQRLLELRQSVEVRQADMNALKAERDQLLLTKNDQSLKDLKDGLLVLTKQLEDVRQDIGHSMPRTVGKASGSPTNKPPVPARQDMTPSEWRLLPSMFQTGSTAKPEVTVLAVSVEHSTATGTRIRVQPGDSLSTLARIHHTSVAAIRQLNHLTKDVIAVGQELVMPTAGGSPTERER